MSFLDFFKDSGSVFFDSIERFIRDSDRYLKDAFASSNIDDSWWAAVVGTPNDPGMLAKWMPVLAPILVILVSIQVVRAVFAGSSIGLARAGIGAVLGIPGTYVAVWLVQLMSAISDEVTAYILGNPDENTASIFIRILGLQLTDGKITGVATDYYMWDGVVDKAGGWQLLGALILAFIIWLLSIILGFVMALRSMAIVLLASMAGWAVVSTSLEITKSWFGTWLSMVVGLILAKPLSAALIVMSQDIFIYSNSSSQFFAGLAGLIMSIAMPFVAINLFKFTPAGNIQGADSAVASGAAAPMRGASRTVSSVTNRVRRRGR